MNNIEKITSRIPLVKLELAAQELSRSYREQSEGKRQKKPFMWKEEHKIAYLALRMPATFGAISQVLKKIPRPIHSLLDAGSGPGTAYLAAKALFPQINQSLAIEKDVFLAEIGKELSQGSLKYQIQDLLSLNLKESFDLVTASYALSELGEENLIPVLKKLWEATGQFLCIVEPGTPYGFQTILQARSFLIEEKAHIVAPCTHENACPWANSREWCHFSHRLERSSLQKRFKEATLGYEDEKYSYVIVSKSACMRPESRIIKTPIKKSGFISFQLCNSQGIHERIYTKRTKESYNEVKKLEWGDALY